MIETNPEMRPTTGILASQWIGWTVGLDYWRQRDRAWFKERGLDSHRLSLADARAFFTQLVDECPDLSVGLAPIPNRAPEADVPVAVFLAILEAWLTSPKRQS